jgi:hypothetical protein
MSDKTVDELVKELIRLVDRIDNYPKNWRPYMDLYDSAMKAMPHLTEVSEWQEFLIHIREGRLKDDFIITRRSGIFSKKVIVEDIRYRAEHRIQRNYAMIINLLGKVVTSEIRNINTETNCFKIIERNKFDYLE